MNPPDFIIAKTSFSLAALVLMGRVAWWLAKEQPPEKTSMVPIAIFAFLMFGTIGALWIGALSWVQARAVPVLSPPVNQLPAVPAASGIVDEAANAAARRAVQMMSSRQMEQRKVKAHEVKTRVSDLAKRLRAVESKYFIWERGLEDTYLEAVRKARSSKDTEAVNRLIKEEMNATMNLGEALKQEWGPLRGEAISARRDLLELLPPQKAPGSREEQIMQTQVHDALDIGLLAGIGPLAQVATYLESLASQLPEN